MSELDRSTLQDRQDKAKAQAARFLVDLLEVCYNIRSSAILLTSAQEKPYNTFYSKFTINRTSGVKRLGDPAE